VPWTGKGANAEEVRQTGAGCLGVNHGEAGGGAVNLEWVAPVLVAVAALVLLDGIRKSIHQVSQREVIVIERFGRYHKTLTAGLSFVVPFIDQPKRYSEKYILTDANGVTQVKQKINAYKISTQEEVLDFPKQRAISRDNAIIELDAVLNFKILHPKIFIYSCVNLPLILSKLLQAQLRNVAGSLELDQMIQDAATLNVLTGLLDMEAQRWGVQIQFVKVQQVKYSHNPQILSLVKDTENKNKEIIIDAKSTKQKAVIESEGQRDKMIKEAEVRHSSRLAWCGDPAKLACVSLRTG
jgi:regulator of protease activity HflC (stomatin/prohibitin superfamily)